MCREDAESAGDARNCRENQVKGAENGLRIDGTNVVEGSDSQNLDKGSKYIYNTTQTLNGFFKEYLGTEGVVFKIDAVRDTTNRIVTIDYGDLLVNGIRVGRGSGDVISNTVVGKQAFDNNSVV